MMEQIVTVCAVNPDGTAEVVFDRPSACGGDCSGCGGCGGKGQRHQVTARNIIGAKPGDRVILTEGTGQVLGAVLAVYLLPLIFLLAGVLWGGLLPGLAGLVLGFLPALALNRDKTRKNRIPFVISAYAPEYRQTI